MANRPVFVPRATNFSPIREIPIDFNWFAGFSVSQQQKSMASLHSAAKETYKLNNILEISSKSTVKEGVQLSAFNLQITLADGTKTSVESAFQSSKVFTGGGPFKDLLHASSKDAKTDERIRNSGPLTHFQFDGRKWPLKPTTAFYDWLYITALKTNPDLCDFVMNCDAFTDIVFNPEKSLNCQARSVAIFVSLTRSGGLEEYMDKAVALTT
jgi:type I restriction enzyme M protein